MQVKASSWRAALLQVAMRQLPMRCEGGALWEADPFKAHVKCVDGWSKFDSVVSVELHTLLYIDIERDNNEVPF